MNDQPPSKTSEIRHSRFGILLAALLAMIIAGPVIDVVLPNHTPGTTQILLLIVFAWITISAVYAVSEHSRAPLVAAALGILLLGSAITETMVPSIKSRLLSNSVSILFLGHIVVVLLRFVLKRTRVDANTIFASLCAYLLLGILWASAYSVLEEARPGRFAYSNFENENMIFGTEGTSVSIYFSFVTMTTLGYGDITPISADARALVMLQAICGQFYLTVLVAWLVGLHVAHTRTGSASPEE